MLSQQYIEQLLMHQVISSTAMTAVVTKILPAQELRSIVMNTKKAHQYRHNQATHKEYDCVALPD